MYGCLFIENQSTISEIKNKINAFCRKRHLKGEIKGSSIKLKDRRKILNIISSIKGVHQFFVIVKNNELKKVDFDNPYKVKRFKQFTIRRIIEEVFKKHHISKDDHIHIKIDNESFNNEEGLKNFIYYLNNFWSKPGSFLFQDMYWEYMPNIQSKFTIKYLDSKHDRLIQMADLIANTKYRRFKGNEKCGSENLSEEVCLKLPDNCHFYSPKSKFYVEN